MTPLDGIRVIDLSRVVSGPFATMMLADMGADVVKLEEPTRGDESRSFGPPFIGGESPYFLSVNRNKRSVTVDLKTDDGQAIIWRLLGSADVLIENFRPGVMARLGFDYDTVAARHPRLVYCSISGFGDTGADAGRPGYDLIVQGEAGLMDVTGEADGPPTRVGTAIADLTSGSMAAQGIVLALYARQTSGRGQRVHVAMLDAVASLLTYNTGSYFASGTSPTRRGNDHPSVVPYQTLRAKDGWINLGVANDSLWARYCKAIDRLDLRDDPRFRTAPLRVEHRTELIHHHRRDHRATDRAGVDGPAGRRRCPLWPHSDHRRGLHESATRRTRQGRRPSASDGRYRPDDWPAHRAERHARPHPHGAAAPGRAHGQRSARGRVCGRRHPLVPVQGDRVVDEWTLASPAVANGSLFVRTVSALYRTSEN